MKILFCLFLFLVIGCGENNNDTQAAQLSGGCKITTIAGGKSCGTSRGPVAFLVMFDKRGDSIGFCSGSFITKNRIITAAHCVDGSAKVKIISGDYISHSVRIIKHPKYKSKFKKSNELGVEAHDVAVIYVANPIDTEPFPILASSYVSPNQTIRVMGYGLFDDKSFDFSSPEKNLRGAKMRVSWVDNYFFYSTYEASNAAACSGDSGGPAIGYNNLNIPGIVGINHAVYAPVDENEIPICSVEGVISIFIPLASPNILNFILKHAPEAKII